MSIESTGRSRDEKKRASAPVPALPKRALVPAEDLPPRLLYSRKQVAHALGGVDVSYVRRLERAGVLKGIRLDKRKATAMVFFRAQDVIALIEDAADA
jgi:hypothetical protein